MTESTVNVDVKKAVTDFETAVTAELVVATETVAALRANVTGQKATTLATQLEGSVANVKAAMTTLKGKLSTVPPEV